MGSMSKEEMMKLGMAVGLCYAAYKFIQHPQLKVGAVAIGAVIVARKLPILGAALNSTSA